MNPPLVPTARGILENVPKLRLLVVGKPECGKSALISEVFGVDPSPTTPELTEDDTTYVQIQGGLTYRENSRFILYTSQDFSPNSDSDFDEIRGFIQERLNTQDPKQELHAAWICMNTPHGGERIHETGVERILEVTHRKIPLIIVLTKFDHLVHSIPRAESGGDGTNDARELAMNQVDDTLRKISLDSLLSQQLVTPVSTKPGYEDTVSTLVQLTDAAIQKLQQKRTHALPKALVWATAQRQDPETTIAAIVDIGREGHWTRLGSTTEFKGRTLEECLSVINSDIVTIWNIADSFSYLDGDDFKARLSHLEEDLACISNHSGLMAKAPELNTVATFAAATANPIATIGAVAEPAKWVSDVYRVTPSCVACIMGYIVDLVLVLSFLSEARQLSEPVYRTIEEDAVDAMKEYINSEILAEVHNEIRGFVVENQLDGDGDRTDVVFEKIEYLVKKFPKRARKVVKASRALSSPAISVLTASDDGFEPRTRERRMFSSGRRSPPSKLRRGGRSVQEDTPDILDIVEQATTGKVQPRSSFERLTVSSPEATEGASRTPVAGFFNWLRRDSRHSTSEEELAKV